jgi:hypothetical protein
MTVLRYAALWTNRCDAADYMLASGAALAVPWQKAGLRSAGFEPCIQAKVTHIKGVSPCRELSNSTDTVMWMS